MAKYFFDTEFDPNQFSGYDSLISIGIVSDDGREFYAISRDFDPTRMVINTWLASNVMPWLDPPDQPTWMARAQIAAGIESFIGADTAPQLWAHYGAFDWVLFCEIFGGMRQMAVAHPGWPWFCRDLQQLAELVDLPRSLYPDKPKREHHALEDARWNKLLFDKVAPKARGIGCYV